MAIEDFYVNVVFVAKKVIFALLLGVLSLLLLSGCLEVGSSTNIQIEYKIESYMPMAEYILRIDNEGKISENLSTIDSEGRIIERNLGTGIVETRTGKISREELEELAKFIIGRGFFSMNNEYDCDPAQCVTDTPYLYLTATIGHQTKTIKIYLFKEHPQPLGEITNKIESYKEGLE